MTMKKCIVIGLDGLEPSLVEQMFAAGELPNLWQLSRRGGFSRVRTTYPAQTPVAWSTFATGLNPGAHGIFDFLRRDPANYRPQLALVRYEQKNPFVPPKAVTLRRGRTVWERLTDHGVPSVVLRCPCSYPPEEGGGRVLSGMGVPDVRGGLGTGTFYTSDTTVQPGEGETVVHLDPAGGDVQSAGLPGPFHPRTGEPVRFELTIEADSARREVTMRSAGEPREIVVPEGSWSDWLRVKFKLGMLQSVRGTVRFYLRSVAPTLELYASPVNFDPESPLFPISAPSDYAGELARELGPYHTTGMVEDHAGLSNGRIDEEAFLAQCDDAWRERESMLFYELNRLEEGLLFCLFDTPDRVQHMFWRFREPDHPANNGGARNGFGHVIEEWYRRCDRTVGRVLEAADDETLVIVLSDHGFGTFRRGVHLNTWLYNQGLLALRDGHRPGADGGDLFRHVDWSRTKAYSLGLSGIYLNRQGRERQGIVSDEEAEPLKKAIARELSGIQDGEKQAIAVRSVTPRENVYHGDRTEEAPDLLVNFASGYRSSWGTALGDAPKGQFEDNTRRWAGDHIIDPHLVPGVLLMNRPFRGQDARLLDLAPTILDAFGAETDSAMEGASLLG